VRGDCVLERIAVQILHARDFRPGLRELCAIHNLQDVLKELEAAPDDFGGNKAAAIRDTHQAIHSVRKALYLRLHMDDAAIDRVQ
jgi:hypothetical protein